MVDEGHHGIQIDPRPGQEMQPLAQQLLQRLAALQAFLDPHGFADRFGDGLRILERLQMHLERPVGRQRQAAAQRPVLAVAHHQQLLDAVASQPLRDGGGFVFDGQP